MHHGMVQAQGWPALGDPVMQRFLRHWAQARGSDHLAAPRSRIDPAAIKPCLPNIWMFRWRPELQDFVCTLAGEAVISAWGQPMIGRSLEQIRPRAADLVRQRYGSILNLPALQSTHRSMGSDGDSVKAAFRLVLPLLTDGGEAYGVIGMTQYRYDPLRDDGKPVDIDAEVKFYRCADLPRDLP